MGTRLVGENDPFSRVVKLGMNPRFARKINWSSKEAIKNNLINKHFSVMLIFHKNGTNLSKIESIHLHLFYYK